MKRNLLLESISAIFLLASSVIALPPPIRIMPLGDSITYGSPVAGGYRLPLYITLTNADYNVDYVGSTTGNSDPGLGTEVNHEGHGGWRISNPTAANGLYEYLYSWFEQIEDPHVVLVHIGTNDTNDPNFQNAINELDALVTRIAACQPSAEIIVTTLMKRLAPNYTNITNYFNPYVYPLVTNHVAQGHKVHFLDMHAKLELADMGDNLHPNAVGYQKMAAAWFPAITNIIGTNTVANQPGLIRAVPNTNQVNLTISFNKKVSFATATNLSNYAIDKGLAVLGASLSANQRTVTLTTGAQAAGTNYTITVNNVADETAPAPLTVPADSQVSFTAYAPPPPPPVRGYTNYVAESSAYRLVYSVDLPTTASYDTLNVPYSVDNSAVVGPFSRVAYYLELQTTNYDFQYVWVSMDAFTNRADKLGLPTFLSGAVYQRSVNNMNVFCSVPGVTTGTGITTGNIEFWPYNYSSANAKLIPNASDSACDFGDTCSYSGNYGCMQVHNFGAGATQTLFAVNHWNAGSTLQMGIGNCPAPVTGGLDWTFGDNAGNYLIRTLQVLVLCDATADATPPAALSAQAGFSGNLVSVTFDEALAASSVDGTRFTLDQGVEVLSATLLSDLKTVNLITTAQPVGAPLTLTLGGVRDLAANGIPAGTTLAVTPASTLPQSLTANVGALANGYRLVYALDIPVKGNFNGTTDFYRINQSNFTGSFDRVAYYVELLKPNGTVAGTVQYLWASMDAFTGDARKIGVPTLASGAVFQRTVDNLDVKSNVSGITNGTGMAGGNLEFWPGNYSAPNVAGIPGASETTYDFGDKFDAGSYGCMQVHNSAAKQTLFGLNNWGANNNTLGLGIGNSPAPVNSGVDWTFADNAGSAYARRLLYVLVRPAAPALPQDVAENVPEAAGYQLAYTVDLPVNGSFNTNSPAYYTVNNYTNGLVPSVFSRIAYYLELRPNTGVTQYVWTAMDAFTTDARKIAVPTNTCYFQQKVTNLVVRSNVGGIVTGDAIATGNIEFWPSSYNESNAIGIPNASATQFDFGDGGASGSAGGYGSMQVHNHGAGVTQTLFAVNNFNNNAILCTGIGNNPGGHRDWTHAYNAASYTSRRLHVFVLPGGNTDATRPSLTKAAVSRSLNQVIVSFSETLADTAATAAFYSLDSDAATVTGATLAQNKKDVVLTTSALSAGQHTVTVTGVRDRSAAGNLILPGSSIGFVASSLAAPDVLSNVPEAESFELIHQLMIDNTVSWQNGCNYALDESRFPRTNAFDRIAYCLELLGTNGVYQWVYVSLDPFTPDITKIGVPTADRTALWQQIVSNLNVYASENVANVSVTTGVGIAAGNIEFWPSNYGPSNDKGVPGASDTAFDFGDGGSPNATTAGHGSMQIHNYLQGHTIFSLIHFGANNYTPGLGIGNNPGGSDLDWTFTNNGPSYSAKNLYVLARPGTPAQTRSGTPPEIWDNPRAQTVYLRGTARFSVYAPAATSYQWRKDGVWIPGAKQSYLVIDSAQLADEAVYDVIVNGTSGYTTSPGATLEVIPYTQPQAPKPLRIMPLGDSITYGSSTPGGYRYPLFVALTNAGYNVDYVGTQTGNATNLLPEVNHEGHGGWTIGNLDSNIIDWFHAIDDPDVILLHIGTNDAGAADFSNRIDRLDALVSRIATNRPNAHIIVTTLLPRAEPTETKITNFFNPFVYPLVTNQAAMGRKVHYLDMHSYLTLSDTYDNVHPNAGGYAKMAAAWFPVITNIVGVYGDSAAPKLSRAFNLQTLDGVKAVFSKAVDPETATNLANYALTMVGGGAVPISGATLSADLRTVTLSLATAALTRNTNYTLTVNNVMDYSWPTQQTIPPNSADTFKATVRGYLTNIPEADDYRLAYAIDLPNSAAYGANLVIYNTNNAAQFSQPVRRVAYYLEVQALDGDLSYVWVSMDAFTEDINKVGIPARITGAVFQQYVNNMNVACNDPSVTTGTGLTGNIEFWPTDYGASNVIHITGASDTLCDFGDDRRTTGSYGSMQVHNPGAGQTLLAFNNWGSSTGATPDLGIGNCPSPINGGVDWTFRNSAGFYPIRSLYVLVALGDDVTPPTLVSAQAGSAGTLVTVTFSEALTPESVDATRFAIDHGVTILSARILPDQRTVNLITTRQPAGETLTLTVTGVRDLGAGTLIAPGSTIPVAPAALPPEVTANVGALANGFQLVYTLDVPVRGNFNGTPDFYRYDQSLATGAFDRVAYYMEIVTASAATQYVWVAMNPLTQFRQQIGVPTVASKAIYQRTVSNLDVKSNVSGVTSGTGMSGGNIEFWPTDYSGANALGIPNATGYYDFGDTRSTAGAHGSMQIHNSGLSQVLFAMNNWGADNQLIALGIGNRPSSNDKDWTAAANAGTYYRRRLHVMVRPSAPVLASDLPSEIVANIADAAKGYQVIASITNIAVKGTFNTTSWAATNYVVDRRAVTVPGSFNRIAYYVELQAATDAVPRYVWTSMDAFTADPTKIGIPLAGTLFQQKVKNLDVFCNVPSVATGTGIATGNIEFWPGNFNQSNAIGIPNANGGTFDFGDGGASSATGHGCMQVHNYGAAQTIWAINHFNSNADIGLGIGNGPHSGDPDYTLTYNAATFTRRVLHILVLPGGDNDIVAPTITGAFASRSLTQVRLTFSEALADSAAADGTFTFTNAVTVLSAALETNKTGIVLTTSPMSPGQSCQIRVSGVRDRSSNTNLIAANSAVNFTTPSATLPPVLSNIPEIGDYSLIHQLAIGNSVSWANGCNYTIDESVFPQTAPFDRIAYCMELTGTNGFAQWAYVSLDAFTRDITKIGVPTVNRATMWQQYISNLNVFASANIAGTTIVTGQVASGNIEFWPSNYGASNDKKVPEASDSLYDFGDGGGPNGTTAGHGSMQVHNYLASQTIFALDRFSTPELGIGNQPTGNPDWTFANNAAAYSVKNLYVLVRPGTAFGEGNGPGINIQPKSVHTHPGQNASFYVQAYGATAYQWRRNGEWITGATLPYLELNPAQLPDAATYDVLVYGASGYTVSQSATLTVTPLGTHFLMK